MHDRRRPRQDGRATFCLVHDADDQIAVGMVDRFDAVDEAGHLGEEGGIALI